jgi:small subunit ribosomal protein S21
VQPFSAYLSQVHQFKTLFELSNLTRLEREIMKTIDLKGDQLTKVELRSNESQQQLLRRFRKQVAKSGKLKAVRRKRWFVSKSEQRRIAKKKAIRKLKRRQRNRRRRRY